jgi:hypothetical protein
MQDLVKHKETFQFHLLILFLKSLFEPNEFKNKKITRVA